jgi:hypothetical protein
MRLENVAKRPRKRGKPPPGIGVRKSKWQLRPKSGTPRARVAKPMPATPPNSASSEPRPSDPPAASLSPWPGLMRSTEIAREQAKRIADKYITRDGSHLWKQR